jgi:lambda family phage portal protein
MSRLRAAFAALAGRQPAAVMTRPTFARRIGMRAGAAIDAIMGWGGADEGVTGLIKRGDYPKLRAQARELERVAPLIARYAEVTHENVWGPNGITLQAVPARTRGDAPNTVLAKQNEAAWYRWCETCDLSGGSLDDAMEWFDHRFAIDGEAALEIVYRSDLLFGVGIRRIDADLIHWSKTEQRKPGQNAIDHGVEMDRDGKPIAYWILSHKLTEVDVYGPVTERRVPASRIVIEKHGNSTRGCTPLAPVMQRADMLNKMQEAVVAQHRAAACKMGFLETALDGEHLAADPGTNMVTMEAASGVIEQLPAGMSFKSWEPGSPGAQYREVYTTLVHEIASGLPGGITYVGLTGDLTEANYSSMRQGELQARDAWRVAHRRRAEAVLQPLYAAVIRGARLAQAVTTTLDDEAVTLAVWHGRVWPWVDPLKDANAIRELLALGLTTRTRELNALGLAAGEVFAELSAEIATMKTLGIPTEVTTVQAQAAAAENAASRPRLTA